MSVMMDKVMMHFTTKHDNLSPKVMLRMVMIVTLHFGAIYDATGDTDDAGDIDDDDYVDDDDGCDRNQKITRQVMYFMTNSVPHKIYLLYRCKDRWESRSIL